MIKIIETQYFPSIYWFKLLTEITNVEIDQYENFRKTSFRNRCVVPGANGLINMTIPIIGGREQRSAIREILIDHSQGWAKTHWRVIASNYSKAPFFEYYQEDVQGLLLRKEKYLFDLNLIIINWLSCVIKYPVRIDNGSNFIRNIDNHFIMDLRNDVTPNNFQKQEFSGKEYQQMFSDRIGFQQNVSVLDLLMCQGPNALNFLS